MFEVTIENICEACGKGPCDEPCNDWYDLLEKEMTEDKDK